MFKASKKVIIGTVAGALLLSGGTAFAWTAYTKNIQARFANIKLVVNGDTIKTSAQPFIYNGNVYAPVATVANALGIRQEWDNRTPSVQFWDNDKLKDILSSVQTSQIETKYTSHQQMYNFVYLKRDEMGEYRQIIGIRDFSTEKEASFPAKTPEGKTIHILDFIEGTEIVGEVSPIKDSMSNGKFAMLEYIEDKYYFTYYELEQSGKLTRLASSLIETPEGIGAEVSSNGRTVSVTLLKKGERSVAGFQLYDIVYPTLGIKKTDEIIK